MRWRSPSDWVLPEPIIVAARAEISPDDLRADDLLNEIHHQRNQSRQARQQAEQARQEAETLRLELITRLEKIEDERQKVLDAARNGSCQPARNAARRAGLCAPDTWHAIASRWRH